MNTEQYSGGVVKHHPALAAYGLSRLRFRCIDAIAVQEIECIWGYKIIILPSILITFASILPSILITFAQICLNFAQISR